MALSDIFSVIDPIAKQLGIPTSLWESIANVESGYNSTAIGDNGTSFGIFQLHIGGQANTALQDGYSTNDLLNPAINAKYALPSIAAAWNNLSASFDDSIAWWDKFASASGHPGGSLQDAAQEAGSLKSAYDAIGGSSGNTNIGTPSNPTSANLSSSSATATSISQFVSNTGMVLLFFVIAISLAVIAVIILH